MESLTVYLIAIPALLILSVVASKGAGRFGIPALSMFLLIGMVVGREGPGGVPFSNDLLAQTLGHHRADPDSALRRPQHPPRGCAHGSLERAGAVDRGRRDRDGDDRGVLGALSGTRLAPRSAARSGHRVDRRGGGVHDPPIPKRQPAGPDPAAARARVRAERSDDGVPQRRPAGADRAAARRVAGAAHPDVLRADDRRARWRASAPARPRAGRSTGSSWNSRGSTRC